MNFSELLNQISFETFADIIALAPRKVRESLYAHYGVKSKSRGFLTSLKEKQEHKTLALQTALKGANNQKEQEFLKELLRNWLFHKRPLLKATLDYLGIENDNGLVDVDTDFFKELDNKKVSALIEHLKPQFPRDDILIYLTFMEVPFLAKNL